MSLRAFCALYFAPLAIEIGKRPLSADCSPNTRLWHPLSSGAALSP